MSASAAIHIHTQHILTCRHTDDAVMGFAGQLLTLDTANTGVRRVQSLALPSQATGTSTPLCHLRRNSGFLHATTKMSDCLPHHL